jgi:hypothetical protein
MGDKRNTRSRHKDRSSPASVPGVSRPEATRLSSTGGWRVQCDPACDPAGPLSWADTRALDMQQLQEIRDETDSKVADLARRCPHASMPSTW